MEPAETVLEVHFLGLRRILSKPNLGTVESRTIKQARKHVQVEGRGHGQVLTGMILCMFYLIRCLWVLFSLVIYNFLFFFLNCYSSYIGKQFLIIYRVPSSVSCMLKQWVTLYLQLWNSQFCFMKGSERKGKKEREGLAIKKKLKKDPLQIWKQGDII